MKLQLQIYTTHNDLTHRTNAVRRKWPRSCGPHLCSNSSKWPTPAATPAQQVGARYRRRNTVQSSHPARSRVNALRQSRNSYSAAVLPQARRPPHFGHSRRRLARRVAATPQPASVRWRQHSAVQSTQPATIRSSVTRDVVERSGRGVHAHEHTSACMHLHAAIAPRALVSAPTHGVLCASIHPGGPQQGIHNCQVPAVRSAVERSRPALLSPLRVT